jgi:hypothetical protein
MKYVHPFIFSLCTIIPMNPDDVLRKGSGREKKRAEGERGLERRGEKDAERRPRQTQRSIQRYRDRENRGKSLFLIAFCV